MPERIIGIENPNTCIREIPLPAGYKRMPQELSSFAQWLGSITLKKDKTVFLYNGIPKRNQEAQFAVLNIPVGKKDLQQCADAVMRLRASYLYTQKRFDEIVFTDNAGRAYRYTSGADSAQFNRYLEKVFAMCGTASLNKQLRRVDNIHHIAPGDVFIKGGFPGHAVMVVDVAINNQGRKIYLLAQSYMPAQDIHILQNPNGNRLNPWYLAEGNDPIITPEWTFAACELKSW